jgi:uncharacterized protein with HEPN domain
MKKDPIIFVKHIIENAIHLQTFSKGITKKNLTEDIEKQYAIVRI